MLFLAFENAFEHLAADVVADGFAMLDRILEERDRLQLEREVSLEDFLDGLPNFQALHKLKVGETVEEILKADLALELEAIPLLKDAIKHCEDVRDYVSREVFERILESEESHVDFLETQFELIARMGLQNYDHLQSEPSGD